MEHCQRTPGVTAIWSWRSPGLLKSRCMSGSSSSASLWTNMHRDQEEVRCDARLCAKVLSDHCVAPCTAVAAISLRACVKGKMLHLWCKACGVSKFGKSICHFTFCVRRDFSLLESVGIPWEKMFPMDTSKICTHISIVKTVNALLYLLSANKLVWLVLYCFCLVITHVTTLSLYADKEKQQQGRIPMLLEVMLWSGRDSRPITEGQWVILLAALQNISQTELC